MSKRKKTITDPNEVFAFLELRLAVVAHCQALKSVTHLLAENKKEAAIARLDGAVTALQATVRGQCVGQTMKCPKCGNEQGVVAWVDSGLCDNCGELLEGFLRDIR